LAKHGTAAAMVVKARSSVVRRAQVEVASCAGYRFDRLDGT
jgi:hypothetical protein